MYYILISNTIFYICSISFSMLFIWFVMYKLQKGFLIARYKIFSCFFEIIF